MEIEMILNDIERAVICGKQEYRTNADFIDAIEAAVLTKLYAAAGASPQQSPLAFKPWSKQAEMLESWTAGASPVQPSQAQAALDAILWYYENCTGSEPSISAFQQMVDRVVKMKPNFCESCAMDIATCDCVTPRPATVTVQPSQADAQDAARYRWLREYLPSDDLQYDDNLVLAKTGEDIDAAIDAAINAKETDRG